MKVILTGATGLIGSRFEQLMFESHEITPLSSSRGIDITDEQAIQSFLEDKEFDAVIHLAGKTDVDGCENDKEEDLSLLKVDVDDLEKIDLTSLNPSLWKNRKTAFAINCIGTKNLYEATRNKNLRFIYISTDFVFEGNGKFDEESEPDPVNWYGMTKLYGERLIDTNRDLIVRLSFPYGYPSLVKQDFVQKLINLLREKDQVSLIEDQTITPTFIDDIVFGLDFLLQKDDAGIYHLTGSSYEDPYHIGQIIKERFRLETKINPTTREHIYRGRAPRPFQSIMLNDKIRELGFEPKTFEEGLDLIMS